MGGWERRLLLVEFLGIFTVRKSESRAERKRDRGKEGERTRGAGNNNFTTHTHTHSDTHSRICFKAARKKNN